MSQPLGVRLTSAYTTQDHTLGEVFKSAKGGCYKFAQANGAITQYQICSIPEDFDAVALTTTISGTKPQAVGIAMATLADNQWGWFAIGPFGTGEGVYVSALASCAADVVVGTTATAGAIDDTFTDSIDGLALDVANGGSTANVLCYATSPLVVNSGGIAA